jgi:hypothetical protein
MTFITLFSSVLTASILLGELQRTRELSMAKDKANIPAITAAAGLAARAITRLEAAAQEVLNGGAPTLQLVADTAGITALAPR